MDGHNLIQAVKRLRVETYLGSFSYHYLSCGPVRSADVDDPTISSGFLKTCNCDFEKFQSLGDIAQRGCQVFAVLD